MIQMWCLISVVLLLASSKSIHMNHPRWGHSKALCVGGDGTNTSWHRTSCLYEDVCISSTNEFLIFDPHESLDIPSITVSLCILGIGGVANRAAKVCKFAPTVIKSSILQYAKSTAWHMTPLVLFSNDEVPGFGHFIGDIVLPLYQIMHTHALAITNVSFFKMNRSLKIGSFGTLTCDDVRNSKENKTELIHNNLYLVCQRNAIFFSKLFPYQIENMHTPTSSKSGGLICFEKVIAGIGYFSDHCNDASDHGKRLYGEEGGYKDHICNFGMAHMLRAFRDFVLLRINVIAPTLSLTKLRVLISNDASWSRRKKHYKGWENILNYVRDASLSWNTCVPVEVSHLNIMTSIQEQINDIYQAAVFVATSGSAAMISVFLSDGASRVIVYDTAGGSRVRKRDNNLFSHVYPSSTIWIPDRNRSHRISYIPHVLRATLTGLLRYCDYNRPSKK